MRDTLERPGRKQEEIHQPLISNLIARDRQEDHGVSDQSWGQSHW